MTTAANPAVDFLLVLFCLGLCAFMVLVPSNKSGPAILVNVMCRACDFKFSGFAEEGILDEYKNKIRCPDCGRREAELVR